MCFCTTSDQMKDYRQKGHIDLENSPDGAIGNPLAPMAIHPFAPMVVAITIRVNGDHHWRLYNGATGTKTDITIGDR